MANRLARRHYAAVASTGEENDVEVLAWCRSLIDKIASDKLLLNLLETRHVEGVLWISILGDDPAPVSKVTTDLIPAAAQLKLSIVLENYTKMAGKPQNRYGYINRDNSDGAL